jgi:hypothetical protein
MAIIHKFQSASKEYVKVPVSAKESGSAVNPTGDTVNMAVTTAADGDAVTSWATASWETDSTVSPAKYYARVLIGPGSNIGQLAIGIYNVFVKITDSPEVPIKYAGQIEIV